MIIPQDSISSTPTCSKSPLPGRGPGCSHDHAGRSDQAKHADDSLPDVVEILNRIKPGWDLPRVAPARENPLPTELSRFLDEHKPGWDAPRSPQARTYRHRDHDSDQIRRRAAAYISRMAPSIQGSGGSAACMAAARAVCWGFDLGEEDGCSLLAAEFNPRCEPPWSERELLKKCRDAMNPTGAKYPRGSLRDADGDYPNRTNHAGRTKPNGSPDAGQEGASGSASPRPAVRAAWLDSPRGSVGMTPPVCEAGCRVICGCPVSRLGGSPVSVRDTRVSRFQGDSANTRISDSALLTSIIGPPPRHRPCPRPVTRWAEGVSEQTAGSDALFTLACGRWSCYVCRERKRYQVKRKHVPIVFRHVTHTFTGTPAEWDRIRKRLDRVKIDRRTVKIKREAYQLLQPDGTLAIVIAIAEHHQQHVPEIEGLTPCRGESAARFFACAVDAVPVADELAPDRVKLKRFRPSRGWKNLPPPPVIENTPFGVADRSKPRRGDWRILAGTVAFTHDSLRDYLDARRQSSSEDTMSDADRGGFVERTLTWQASEHEREQIREAGLLRSAGVLDAPIPD